MIDAHIRTEILARLRRSQQEHGVRILLAVESGSRAWGFASPDSDYDVRFIYVHEPAWYQAVDLEERRDVIEYPITDDIDLNGWDLRKALRLFRKSNPAFVEWIQSPITYLQNGGFREQALAALPLVYTPIKGMHHYLNMAHNDHRNHLQQPQVKLKKYFYVLRALLSARWIERNGIAPPIEFHKLLDLLDDQPQVLQVVRQLLERKRNTPELGSGPPLPALDGFIHTELTRTADPSGERCKYASAPTNDLLNQIFHAALREHVPQQ